MASLHTAAFQSDQLSNLMLLTREPDAHQTLMHKSISLWTARPDAEPIKALDSATGEVLGWSCWIVKDRAPEPLHPSTAAVDPARALGGVYTRAGFEEVGRGEYDLDEWAPEGNKGGWGVYTFRYMVRWSGKKQGEE